MIRRIGRVIRGCFGGGFIFEDMILSVFVSKGGGFGV